VGSALVLPQLPCSFCSVQLLYNSATCTGYETQISALALQLEDTGVVRINCDASRHKQAGAVAATLRAL
jgi:hypothetical protein